ncbi:hypothetical protein OH77DRAFT_567302 [Trametes cingulata]|nr:hypothetical protein OH77DRAFT_567302 [Trametes cingulata]
MSTSSSSAASTPTPSGTPPPPPPSGFQSIFQSAGGPPLILVCIAAGLLLGAFAGMFLMKRLRPGVVVVQRVHGGLGGAGAAEVKLGEKPKLYDIHVEPASVVGESRDEAGQPWANIYPFAAVYLPPSPSEVTPPPPTPSTPPSTLSRLLARLPLRHLHHRSASTRPGKGHAPPSPTSTSPPTPPLRAVQLAFAVSMPNPALHAPKSADDDREDDAEDDDTMPDCCIGTTVRMYRPESVGV